jgi:hypothetical protein
MMSFVLKERVQFFTMVIDIKKIVDSNSVNIILSLSKND